MAKVTKKNSKKSKTEVVKKPAPPVPEGMVSIVMDKDDLRTFANLLSICSQTFEKLAFQAAAENDESSFAVLKARCQLSATFATKLVEAAKMPEPISRDFH